MAADRPSDNSSFQSRPKFRKRFGITRAASFPFAVPYVRPKKYLLSEEQAAATISALDNLTFSL